MPNQKLELNSNQTRQSPVLASREEVELVRDRLRATPRDLLLFDLAVQTGLAMTDLLPLKVRDLSGLAVGGRFPFAGPDQGGPGPVMTADIRSSLQSHLEQNRPHFNDYLFRSRKGNRPLNLTSVSDLATKWFAQAGLNHLSGVRPLKRTYERLFKNGAGSENGPAESPDGMGRIEAPTLQEMVHDRLLKAITTGRVKPGQRLLPSRLSREMGVSSMTIREALLRLEGAGFFTHRGNRRFTVRELSHQDVKEIYDVRLALESLAVERACLRRTEETLNRLRTRLKLMELYADEGFRDQFLEVHEDFHLTLCRDAEMPNLSAMLGNMLKKLRPYLRLAGGEDASGVIWPEVDHHRRMVEALNLQDQEAIKQHLSEDISSARRRTLTLAPVRRLAKPTFRVGLCMTFTGPSRVVSVAVSNGCRLVAERFNRKGGLLIDGQRRRITFHEAEADFSAEGAAAMARQLIARERVHMIVGPLVSQTTAGAQSVTEPERVITLTTGLADEIIALPQGGRFTFRSFIGVSELFPRLFGWLAENHPEADRLAMVDLDYASAWKGQEMVKRIAPGHGQKVVHAAFYPEGTRDFRPLMADALATDPDIILNVGSFPDEWAKRMKIARAMGYQGLFVECLPSAPGVLVPLAGSEVVEGLIGIDYLTRGAKVNPASRQFRRTYTETYGRWNPFTNTVAPSFEATLQAFEAADSLDSGRVVEVLESGREWRTSLGLNGYFGAAARYGQPHQWLSPMWLHRLTHGRPEPIPGGRIGIEEMIRG